MAPNLFIRFKGTEEDSDSQVSLSELGESLTGFHSVLTELNSVMGITIEPEVQATALRDGSVIVDLVLFFRDASDALPFDSITDLVEFLKLAEEPKAEEVESFFQSVEGAHRSINDWAAQNPADFEVFKAALNLFWVSVVLKLIKKAGFFKKGEDPKDKTLSRKKQRGLHKMVKKRSFKKALAPLREDKAKSIEVSNDRNFKHAVMIDQHNMENYLADDDTILPHLKDGMTYDLHGTITSLKATRGDRMTLQISHEAELYNLDALPAPGLTSKNYKDFYTESVNVRAEVHRTSLYKKPKLRLHGIELRQTQLELDDRKLNTPTKKDLQKLMELAKTTETLVQTVSKAKPLEDAQPLPQSDDIGYSLNDDDKEPPLMLTQGE